MAAVTAYPHMEQRPDGKLWLTGNPNEGDRGGAGSPGAPLGRRGDPAPASAPDTRANPQLLAYYYDHQPEMDRLIDEQLRTVQQFRGQQGGSGVLTMAA